MPKFEFDKTEIKFIIELIDNGFDKKLQTKLKDLHYADIAEIKNAGHWLHADQPGLFVEKVAEFIGK